MNGNLFARRVAGQFKSNDPWPSEQEMIAREFDAAVAVMTAERDAAVEKVTRLATAYDECTRATDAARADAAAMRELVDEGVAWAHVAAGPRLCPLDRGAKEFEAEAKTALSGDAGRALLAEVARLREENAALNERVCDLGGIDDVCDVAMELHNLEIIDHATARAALGRVHDVLQELVDVVDDPDYRRDSFTTQPARAVLADPTGRAAAEYVAALEAEHEAAAELKVSVDLRGVKAAIRFTDAHAVVEALRAVKP